jgi:hypothetical protein
MRAPRVNDTMDPNIGIKESGEVPQDKMERGELPQDQMFTNPLRRSERHRKPSPNYSLHSRIAVYGKDDEPIEARNVIDNYEMLAVIDHPGGEDPIDKDEHGPVLDRNTQTLLKEYNRHMDNLTSPGFDDFMWEAITVLGHSVRIVNMEDQHIKVKVLWRNGEGSWVRLEALSKIQDPYIIIQNAVAKKLTRFKEWEGVKQYTQNKNLLNELSIMVMKATRAEVRYKFSVG